MKKKKLMTKVLPSIMAASMIMSLCPATAFAADNTGNVKLKDGVYTETVKCYPDEDEDFTEYDLTVNVTIKDGKISAVDGIKGNGDTENDSYIQKAVNGTKKSKSVVSQILEANGTSGVDTVSGATCTSKSIIEAVNNAITKASATEEYKYVYASIPYAEYWSTQGVQAAGDASSSSETDTRGEYDKGAFDAVTRATTNHGLHRGNFQQDVTIYDTDGNAYEMDHWTSDGKSIVLTDGTTIGFSRGTITLADNTTKTMDHYEITGIKYVPVKVKSSDYDAFKEKYEVVENGGTLAGGYGEGVLNSYSVTANVTAYTNGLKTAIKNDDGTFTFTSRQIGTDSGIEGQTQKRITDLDSLIYKKDAEGNITGGGVKSESTYGDFLRVDFCGDYADLAANMQAVKWEYYPDGDTTKMPVATYGTKFAADNWMHKSMGIQLGLTESQRCQLPEGYDGSGTWTITVYALGYADTTVTVKVDKDDIHSAHIVSDVTALQAAITNAEKVNAEGKDAWIGDWDHFQEHLTEAKDELAAYEKDNAKGTTQEKVNAAAADLIDTMDHLTLYMQMNIPYADFYANEENSSTTSVDIVSSATKSKTKNGNIVSGSYHSEDGSEINGVTYPVVISATSWADIDWSQYTKVTDEDTITIETNNHGQVSKTEYKGKDALFQKGDYAYYNLATTETPDSYKTVTVTKDGKLSFSKVNGEVKEVTDADASLSASTPWGDYCFSLSTAVGKELGIAGVDKRATVYGAVITDTDGNSYGMRHLENIWNVKGTAELAWSVGYKTTEPHGNTLNAAHYKNLEGATIASVTYYTSNGNYKVNVGENGIYVPYKFSGWDDSISAENADVAAGKTTVAVNSLPTDYQAVYTVDGLDGAEVKDGVLSFDATKAKAGSYTLAVKDAKGKYVDLSADFMLTTDKTTVAYNDAMDKLIPAEGFTDDYVSAYAKAIKSVSVNGTSYAASGRGAVTIINEDGSINEEAAPFKDAEDGTTFDITVKADGYNKDYSFTYTKSGYTYAYAAVPYAEYYANEDVQNAGSTESSDVKDTNGEYDTGAFDTVTRATANHGLHRGSFQQDVVIYDTDGNTYEPVYWTDANTAVLSNGKTLVKTSDRATGVTTLTCDGKTTTYKGYEIKGIKYVPIKVKTKNYEAFKKAYTVVENGNTLAGGYGENSLKSYSVTANVTENTNGLKTVLAKADGSFEFSARQTGTESGIEGQELKTITDLDKLVYSTDKDGNKIGGVQDTSSYGDFLRVDFRGDYGDLAANMQAVEWKYYPDGDTSKEPVATYGTKFAADNWMHKSMGIQLGLTESQRCQLPEGYDGSGTWTITVYALGYADTTVTVNVDKDDLHVATPVKDTSKLEAAIKEAEALNKEDYTEESWNNLETELGEAKETMNIVATTGKTSQETVDEDTAHLNAAIAALVKVAVRPDGLADTPEADGKYYYYIDGKVATDVTSIVPNANGWWYVKDGEVDFDYTGFAENSNGWWYVVNGAVKFDVNSIIYGTVNGETNWWHVVNNAVTYDTTIAANEIGWWRVENGRVNFQYNGITNNENGWWKVESGKVNFDYNGISNNENGWWYIQGGKVDFNHTGVDANENGWWRVENGKVNFGYNGITNNANGWWYIRDGKVDFSYTGVAGNENGWWRVENGKVNFDFNGLAQNENGWWYIRGGKVDFNYNGTTNWYGTNYKIRGGKVIF